MRTLIISLLLFISASAQIAVTNNTFSDFTMDNDANTVGHWIFDSYYSAQESTDSIFADLSGNSNPLKRSSGFDYSAQLSGSNPAYYSGNALAFIAANTNYTYIANAAAGDFHFGTGDFTIEGWFTTDDDISTTQAIVWKGASSAATKYYCAYIASGRLYAKVGDGSGVLWVNYYTNIETNTTYYFAFRIDRDGTQELYLNNQKTKTQTSTNSVDITNSNNFVIGSYSLYAASYNDCIISQIRVSSVARTVQEIAESYGLANGWTWDGTGTVSNINFAQALANSAKIYTNFPDTTNQSGYQWTATFDAYGGKAGDAITAQLGSGAAVTQILTGSSASYTLDLGAVTTSSDSIYFTASAGDTVYIDNIIVTEAAIATDTPQRNFRNYNKWSGFKP